MSRALYVEASTEYEGNRVSVFLAGGITGCPDWQAEARKRLDDLPIAILNPRRADFPIDDPSAARGQIEWEFRHLRRVSVVMFWFPASGPVTQPIALYELGRHAALTRRIVVGADPAYIRRQDVDIQLKLARPEIAVYDTLEDTAGRAWRELQWLL